MSKILQLNIRFVDFQLDDRYKNNLPKNQAGCFVHYNDEFIDAIFLKEEKAYNKYN